MRAPEKYGSTVFRMKWQSILFNCTSRFALSYRDVEQR
ncbi:hypothetical protein ACPOL_0827 [Acidisarcina polymorpha]|uniref:Uncharacterized protein n=1 Tax=Acidisarcina polymorpha TaxID=2211140 RepID=A0A2Z5FUN1_9BACT|nr:hypothetical protein ACPOL_0827 [Acidisarcina polymorpha]